MFDIDSDLELASSDVSISRLVDRCSSKNRQVSRTVRKLAVSSRNSSVRGRLQRCVVLATIVTEGSASSTILFTMVVACSFAIVLSVSNVASCFFLAVVGCAKGRVYGAGSVNAVFEGGDTGHSSHLHWIVVTRGIWTQWCDSDSGVFDGNESKSLCWTT